MFRDSNARKVVPLMAAATAVTTVAATGAVDATPAPQVDDLGGLNALAGLDTDGTYESCEAYFGWGKEEGVADVVAFDVEVQNPIDATTHTVGNGVEVVLVIENDLGETLECVPFEVTAEMWDDEFDVPLPWGLPGWPGPGHYAYPSVAFGPTIDGFGDVVAVGFRVVEIPDGLTLVAPPGVQPLDQGFSNLEIFSSGQLDARVLAIIADAAGPDAVASYEAAVDACINSEAPVVDADLEAAMQALLDYLEPGEEIGPIDCNVIGLLYEFVWFKTGVVFVAGYTEPIMLAGPTPTTTAPSTTAATPAATATPRFTG